VQDQGDRDRKEENEINDVKRHTFYPTMCVHNKRHFLLHRAITLAVLLPIIII
jgi:hypothetical protein